MLRIPALGITLSTCGVCLQRSDKADSGFIIPSKVKVYYDEQEFIDKSLVLIEKLRKAKRYELMNIFFDDVPDPADLKKTLDKIVVNITKVRNIPINKRHFDFYLFI